MKERCRWVGTDPLYIRYHDEQWGVPVHEDRKLFEFLILEGCQAGLSWITILRKRENYCRAFDEFDPEKIAGYDLKKIQSLLADEGIVRNRLKIEAAVANARSFLNVRDQFGSFDRFIWDFVGGRPKRNAWDDVARVPSESAESRRMSRELKRLGFKFVGPTICYAFMQAVGMVNDHTTNCFRYHDICKLQ